MDCADDDDSSVERGGAMVADFLLTGSFCGLFLEILFVVACRVSLCSRASIFDFDLFSLIVDFAVRARAAWRWSSVHHPTSS